MVWIEDLSETQENVRIEMARDENPKTVRTGGVYGSTYNHRNGLKLFLDESRHLDYKVIGLVLREI